MEQLIHAHEDQWDDDHESKAIQSKREVPLKGGRWPSRVYRLLVVLVVSTRNA